jgi:hypothetical protein
VIAEFGECVTAPSGEVCWAEEDEWEVWVCRVGWQERVGFVEGAEGVVSVAGGGEAFAVGGGEPGS